MYNDEDAIINGGLGEKPKPKEIVKRFVDLVEAGSSPEVAAKIMGLDESLVKNKELKDQFQELLLEASFPPEVQRAIVRASRIKILAETMSEGMGRKDEKGNAIPMDVGLIKLALEANKQIASDPEVALQQPPQVSVNIGFEKSRDLLDKTAPVLKDVQWDDNEPPG